MNYRVPRSWEGATVAILAGGPSLKAQDLSPLRDAPGVKIITINDSWRMWPRADVFYFCDAAWWQQQQEMNPRSLDNSLSFHEAIYRRFWIKGGAGFDEHPQVRQLRFSGQVGFDPDPAFLRSGSNSGYQAIHLAAHFGAARVVLLGYDMRCDGARTHWHDRPGVSSVGFGGALASEFLPLFDHLAAPLAERGVEVVNATPGSALALWPSASLADALTTSRPAPVLPGSGAAERRRLRPRAGRAEEINQGV